MSFILKSKTVIFDKSYLTMADFLHEVSLIATAYKKQGIDNNSVCLLKIEKPLELLKALLALLSLKAVVALINPKLPTALNAQLLEDLGPHTLIDTLSYSKEPSSLDFDETKISLLLATSGSTKRAKWIGSTLTNWKKSVEGSLYHLKAKSYQPWLLSLPLFHVSGLAIVFRAFYSHAPLLLCDDITVNNVRISLIPAQIIKLDREKKLDLFLKASSVLIGGARLDSHTFKKCAHLPCYITYGATESCSQITSSECSPAHLTVGTSLTHRTLCLDENAQILIKGEAVCDYQWLQKKLIPLKTADGYYPTNDLGRLIDGKLVVLARADERIEIKGEKIYPSFLEEALKEHFPFQTLIITHVMQENSPCIIAFCDPMPSEAEKKRLKESLGSLFFPKHFFLLESISSEQKILLKDLKAKALQLL